MKKSEFKKAFIEYLSEKGIAADELRVKSALEKMARHSRNRDGVVEWNTNDLGNTYHFYNEYKEASTFNRDTYKNNR